MKITCEAAVAKLLPRGRYSCIVLAALLVIVIVASTSAESAQPAQDPPPGAEASSQPAQGRDETGLPADRDASANWRKAGLLSVGGIPTRTTVCATVTPLGNGQDDTARIQTAIDACPLD